MNLSDRERLGKAGDFRDGKILGEKLFSAQVLGGADLPFGASGRRADRLMG